MKKKQKNSKNYLNVYKNFKLCLTCGYKVAITPEKLS